MRAFLVTYRPLAVTSKGRRASATFNLPVYVDGSCRREPDLQSHFPSVSAICRLGKFAPRLLENDEILYLTVKSSFGQQIAPHYKVVAHLKVYVSFKSHKEAADWYNENSEPLPSNCMVFGNPPIPYAQTNAHIEDGWQNYSDEKKLQKWDALYRSRARRIGSFHACKLLWCDLLHPPKLFPQDLLKILGRVPCTQTPPSFTVEKIRDLLKYALQQNGI